MFAPTTYTVPRRLVEHVNRRYCRPFIGRTRCVNKQDFKDVVDEGKDAVADKRDAVAGAFDDFKDAISPSKAEEKVGAAYDSAKSAADDARGKASDLKDGATSALDGTKGKVTDATNDVKGRASDVADDAKSAVRGATESASDVFGDAASAVAGAGDHITELSQSTRGFRLLITATMAGYAILAAGIFFPGMLPAVSKPFEGAVSAAHGAWYNTLGSIFASFAAMSFVALKNPLKFSPLFALQALYKAVWLVTTVLPSAVAGTLPALNGVYVAITLVIFAMDLLFVPWSYILEDVRGVGKDVRRNADDMRDKAEDAYAN